MASPKDHEEEDTVSFEKRIRETVSMGFLIPCISLGSKLGLFDKMAEFTEPKTSQEIADSMNYKERYVREWLSSMVCLRVFDLNMDAETYFFPENRHTLFTSKGGKKNIANFSQGLPLSMQVYHTLLKCFEKDGPRGVPYEDYVGFHEWREDRIKIQFSEDYLSGIFEQDPELIKKLESGISVCDMGCSTGGQVRLLAKMFPKSNFLGADIGENAIQLAKEQTDQSVTPNLDFLVQDICNMPSDWAGKFDLVMVFDVIHDLAYPSKALKAIHGTLKESGQFYMMDISSERDPRKNAGLLYSISLFHCMAQSMFYEGSEALGTCWGEVKARQMFAEVGFSKIQELNGPEAMYMHFLANK